MAISVRQLAVNTLRTLSMDSVERAQSGHPGMPLGAAPMAMVLWTAILKQNPKNPKWFNRDRFVLSSGHGSVLLYSLLHLSGFNLSINDLKNFRQSGSKTPGHPEYHHTPGVEATTGPLGQGIAMSIGMAIAERHLAAVYNKEGYPIVDHFTYCICGDGDLMEGVSSESASLAGHLQLGKYILLYDSNGTCLDGNTDMSFTENVIERFRSYGWQVLLVNDGNNIDEIEMALETAKMDNNRPTLIEVKTTIGYGSPNKSGSHVSHGAPLGEKEVALTKAFLGWDDQEKFHVPNDVYGYFRTVSDKGERLEEEWDILLDNYRTEFPELAKQLERVIKGSLPDGWDKDIKLYENDHQALATRVASHRLLNEITYYMQELIGGAADLASSTKTVIEAGEEFRANHYQGRNISYGVREFAMGAISNGLVLHGGLRVFASTYFVFSDYMRSAIRLSALMGLPVTYIFTHDSIAVGEDGPTHQPIEQLSSLRSIPRLSLIRPADANETVFAWEKALKNQDHPTVLVLSRQNLPILKDTVILAKEGVAKGAYVLSGTKRKADVLLMASGSEVYLLSEAKKQLLEDGIEASVISFPSWDLFEAQSQEYQNKVLPDDVNVRIAVEMGSSLGWHKYVGRKGIVLGIDEFGRSGKGNEIIKEFNFSVEQIVATVKKALL